MGKLFRYFLILALPTAVMAQPGPNPGMNELKEKVIPWSRMLAPNGNVQGKSTTVQGRKYTPYQIGLIDSFTSWIRKSYIPVGGVPQPERLALPESRENKLYQPYGTGVGMALWSPCYDPSGQKIIKAQPASASRIVILTNHLKGLEEAFDLNTPSQYFFTMYYDTHGRLVNDEDAAKNEPYVEEIRSRIGNYFIYFTGSLVNVLLMPGNELPVVQITRADVLDKAAEAIKRIYPDPTSSVHKEVLANIRKYRDKYAGRLNEPAFVHMSQLSISSFTGDYDPFEPLINSRYMYPVYQFKPSVYGLAKLDKPQWVHISFPYATEKSKTVEWEIFKAMTRNFNYQFVYDYFFNPEKVKGKTYEPRNPVSQSGAESTINTRENKATQARSYPEGVHFLENFADAQSGAMPAGWSSRQKNRGFEIVTIPGESSKWLYMDSGADLLPASLKKPLPDNFTLEFDLICTDYTNRTGRTVTVTLGGTGATARLSITPGNEENIRIYPSMANFRVNAQGGSPGYHNIEFSSYSNKKTKAHVKIIRSGTSIVAYINGTKVESDPKYQQDYEKEMAVPANSRFTNLDWSSDTVSQNPPVDMGKVYISNIKITKD